MNRIAIAICLALVSQGAACAPSASAATSTDCDLDILKGNWDIFLSDQPDHVPVGAKLKIAVAGDVYSVELKDSNGWSIVSGSVDYVCDVDAAPTISARIEKDSCQHRIAIYRVPLVKDLRVNPTSSPRKKSSDQIEVVNYAHVDAGACAVHLQAGGKGHNVHPGHIHGDK